MNLCYSQIHTTHSCPEITDEWMDPLIYTSKTIDLSLHSSLDSFHPSLHPSLLLSLHPSLHPSNHPFGDTQSLKFHETKVSYLSQFSNQCFSQIHTLILSSQLYHKFNTEIIRLFMKEMGQVH